ncbi:hypothetical protein BaRGS_00007909 [Batillaria attramentaria]|uniref:Uncharacterized protein n=1 Tax=Batillaria attramentaria TaxID=370345 RepID=A0ABD0LNK1_9CAEN
MRCRVRDGGGRKEGKEGWRGEGVDMSPLSLSALVTFQHHTSRAGNPLKQQLSSTISTERSLSVRAVRAETPWHPTLNWGQKRKQK